MWASTTYPYIPGLWHILSRARSWVLTSAASRAFRFKKPISSAPLRVILAVPCWCLPDGGSLEAWLLKMQRMCTCTDRFTWAKTLLGRVKKVTKTNYIKIRYYVFFFWICWGPRVMLKVQHKTTQASVFHQLSHFCSRKSLPEAMGISLEGASTNAGRPAGSAADWEMSAAEGSFPRREVGPV